MECGDVQAAKNLMCSMCGAPQPKLSSNSQAAKLGDWICPNPACQDVQFERNLVCRRCGTAKPVEAASRPGVDGTGGDGAASEAEAWTCQECYNIQLGTCLSCPRCGVPKPKVSSNNIASKKGDWICPNARCQDVQFERNSVCRRCGTPKPADPSQPSMPTSLNQTQRPAGGSSQVVAPEDWMCAECGDHQFARNLACRKCGAPRPKVSSNNIASKKGDWICPNPNCQDVQFERNMACRRCGAPKPGMLGTPMQGGVPFAGGSPMQVHAAVPVSLAGPAAFMSTNKQILKPGDWICPNAACRDVQFGKNEVCRKCGTSKPMMSSNKQAQTQSAKTCSLRRTRLAADVARLVPLTTLGLAWDLVRAPGVPCADVCGLRCAQQTEDQVSQLMVDDRLRGWSVGPSIISAVGASLIGPDGT